MIAVFLSKLDHRPLFNYIYYETILVGGLVSIYTAYSIHNINLNLVTLSVLKKLKNLIFEIPIIPPTLKSTTGDLQVQSLSN